jgi:iron complex transport system ATP-binding protein
MQSPPLLIASDVRYGYPARPDFLGPINLPIQRGECWGVIGPNGSGKSTLVRLLAGLRRPDAGSISLHGRPLAEISPTERARSIAFLPQHLPVDLQMPVRNVVLLGRYPHRRLGLFESPEDLQIAAQSMQTTDVYAYRDRPLATLSGGEAQRVHLAAALAQEPELLILDEPTAGLDLLHQLQILDVLHGLAHSGGSNRIHGSQLAVVLVTHEINLAARYCTHILLLNHGRVAGCGPPQHVVRREVLEPIYKVRMSALTDATGRPWLVPHSEARAPDLAAQR